MTYSVKEIVDPNEWERLKEIRLKALKSDPGAFQRSYEEEAAKDEDDWRALIVSTSRMRCSRHNEFFHQTD
jgi:hypothetical protein